MSLAETCGLSRQVDCKYRGSYVYKAHLQCYMGSINNLIRFNQHTVLGTTQQFHDLKPVQEAQGLGALLDKMADNDHIKLDNIEI